MKSKLLLGSLFSLLIVTAANAQWYQQATNMNPVQTHLTSIHCVDGYTCMVVGNGNTARKTTDGLNWNVPPGNTGITNKVFVKMLNKDTILLGQVNGTFCRTTNGATNWTIGIPGVTSQDVYYNDVAFTSNSNFTAVGGNSANHVNAVNVTATSTNTGANWSNLTGSGYPTFFGMHAYNTNTIVACGGSGSVYKTTNGGTNWTVKQTGAAGTTFYDMSFAPLNPQIGYVVGGSSATVTATSGGTVLKTTDGGETWSAPANAGLLPNTIYGVHVVDQDTAYVVGNGGKIQVTVDGGATWTAQNCPVTTTLTKVYFPSSKVGYICGSNAVILKTITGGFVAPLVVNAGADASICPGFCATLGTAPVASGGTTPYTYSWNTGGTTSSIVACSSTSAAYTLTVTDGALVTTTDVVNVTVHTIPAVSFSGLDTVYCNGTTAVALVGTPSGGTFGGAGVTSGIFNAAAAGAGTHAITYTFTTTDGCVLTTTDTTKVLPMIPAAQVCLVTVDSNIVNTSNIVTWTKPVTTAIDSFRVYRRSGAGFTKIATLGYNQDTKYVDNASAADPNTAPHTYAIGTLDTCGIESVMSDTNRTIWLDKPIFSTPPKFVLNWSRYDGFTFAQYEIWKTIDNGANWTKLGGVASHTAVPTTFTDAVPAPSTSSRYRIRASYPSGCNYGTGTYQYTLSNATLDYTAVNEISLDNWLKVYPNPNHGTFHMELSGTGFEVQGTKVYNMLGEVVYQSADKNKKAQISIPGIAPGVYHLEIRTDNGTAHKKITIQ